MRGGFGVCHWGWGGGGLQKRSVPPVSLYAPASDEATASHHDTPNANEPVLAGPAPNAQTFALLENSQDVIGKLSFCFHARIRPAARRSDRSMPLMTLLFKHSGRDDKTPYERFHCPEVILESEGGSGRVVGDSEVWNYAEIFQRVILDRGPQLRCCVIRRMYAIAHSTRERMSISETSVRWTGHFSAISSSFQRCSWVSRPTNSMSLSMWSSIPSLVSQSAQSAA